MSGKFEVLLTNDASGQLWNSCLWDPNTGSSLATFKGCISAPHTSTILGETFLISAQPSKPLLNVWQLNRREQRAVKQTTPGNVQALAASPCGRLIVLGISEKLFIYQTCSGKLLNIIARHYQDVTHVAFTDDGSHFVSCGADGNTFVWSLLATTVANKLPGESSSSDGIAKPLHHWSHHGLSITGLVVGLGGIRSRVFTVSKDQTCKINSIVSGNLLLDVTFNVPLSAVAVDITENSVFVGSASGPIYTFSTLNPPRDLKMTLMGDKKINMFSGHTQEVTCLSISTDGFMLASGSKDFDVRVWHIPSRQCIRTLGHKGIIGAVKFLTPIAGIFEIDSFKPSIVFAPFEKNIQTTTTIDENYVIQAINQDQIDVDVSIDSDSNNFGATASGFNGLSNHNGISSKSLDNFEINQLKEINLQLYQHAVKRILQNGSQ